MIGPPIIKYSWIAERNEWMAVVAATDGEKVTLLWVACEETEKEIIAWCELAHKNKPWEIGGKPTPDMYERAKRH